MVVAKLSSVVRELSDRQDLVQTAIRRAIMKTKGELETAISSAIVRFKRDYMGWGREKCGLSWSKIWPSFDSRAF